MKNRLRQTFLLALFGCASAGAGRGADAVVQSPVYVANCAPCHGKDGRARTPAARRLKVKDLTQSRIADEEIRRQILAGRQDNRGKQVMPAYADKLTAEQITALIAIVKGIRK